MREKRIGRKQPRSKLLSRLGWRMVSAWRSVERDRQSATQLATMQTFPAVLGTSGARELIEPHLRSLVAAQLGVDANALGTRVSLRDDLAADSLDLVEMALVVEREFTISIPDRVLEDVLSYGDLVDTTVRLVLERAREQRVDQGVDEAPPQFWARLVLPESVARGTLACAGFLTPYTAETLVQDAQTAGAGAHLDITVARSTSDVEFAHVGSRFARLAARGVRVNVRRSSRGVAVEAAAATQPPAATG